MDTSDSEYFESADEDFDSQYEDNKANKLPLEPHHPTYLTATDHDQRIIEPKLCNLKIEENVEIRCELIQKTVQGEEHKTQAPMGNNSKPPGSTKTHTRTRSKGVSDLSLSSSRLEDVERGSQHICDDDEELKSSKIDAELEKLPSIKLPEENTKGARTNSKKNDTTDKVHIETIMKEPSKSVGSYQVVIQETPSANVPLNVNITKSTKKIEVSDPSMEENLWDNDELDWESEAQKEEGEKTARSQVAQECWDDFDAEWEAHNTPSKQDSQSITKPLHTSETDHQTVPKFIDKDDNLCNEDWESLDQPSEKPKEGHEESNWGNWGGWGVSSILNTATSLTSQVSQGFSTVIENGMGIPQPEELARINREGIKTDIIKDNATVGFGLGNLVSSVSQLTKFMESTGNMVITGGLDTLEAIGKKTVEVLQEGDPGFKKKRAFLKLDSGKPNLSQTLREAKEKAEEENKESREESIKKDGYYRSTNYETLFDDYQGIVHLEALEMLSKLCLIKLDNIRSSLTGGALKDLQETLEQVKELSELPEDEESEIKELGDAQESISDILKEIDIPISFEKFFDIANRNENGLGSDESVEYRVMHQQTIELLAQLTALAVEQFHKAGELLLIKEHRSTVDEADGLVQLTTLIKACMAKTAKQYADQFSTMDNTIGKKQANEYITNIFYEAANSATYIQNAFQLLIPVLQVGAV